LDIRVTERKY